MTNMNVFLLDGDLMKNREHAHEYIARELGFPSYYGKNLDALYECLTDISENTLVIIVNEQQIINKLEYYGNELLATFRDAAEANPNLDVRMEAMLLV